MSNNAQNEYDEEIIVAPLSSKELEVIRSCEILIKRNKENGLEKIANFHLTVYERLKKQTASGWLQRDWKRSQKKVEVSINLGKEEGRFIINNHG